MGGPTRKVMATDVRQTVQTLKKIVGGDFGTAYRERGVSV